MATNEYAFVTKWTVQSTTQQVYDILIRGKEFVRWWPKVYLKVEETNPGGEHGLGKAANLNTKGWLPYTLKWSMEIDIVDYPRGFSLKANGDFVGRGTWSFVQLGDEVDIEFDWRLKAEKPLLKYLSFAFKPFFSSNHSWAMARGLEGLKQEIKRCQK